MNSPTLVLADSTAQNAKKPTYVGLRACCWMVALALGAAQAWATRFTMNPDGISYLDIGDAYWRHDWHNAINAYWSPLYSWILGGVLTLLKPSMTWEFPIVHLANFSIYMVSLACFEVLLKQLGITESWMRSFAYAVFIFSALVMVGMQTASPDMLVTAFVYLIAGLSLKTCRSLDRRTALLYGAVLGLAYLAKTVLLPIGIVFLGVTSVMTRRRTLIWSVLVYLVVAVPWIVVCSVLKHRVTIGESGRHEYLIYVNKIDPFYPQQSPGTRLISSNPEVYDLSILNGTYPAWLDPSHWQDGIKPRWDLSGLIARLRLSAFWYFAIFISPKLQLNLSIGFLLAAITGSEFKKDRRWLCIAVPCVVALLAYAPLVVQFRYVAAFILLLWLLFFVGLQAKKIVIGFLIVSTLMITGWDLWMPIASGKKSEFALPAATALERSHLKHDRIGLISTEIWEDTAGRASFIARLAKAHIVAESIDTSLCNREFSTSSFGQIDGILAYCPDGVSNPQEWTHLAESYFYRTATR